MLSEHWAAETANRAGLTAGDVVDTAGVCEVLGSGGEGERVCCVD